MEFSATSLWVTPLVEVRNAEHAKLKPGLVRHCYELQQQAKEPIESGVTPRRKANLYESRFDFFRHAQPEVQALRQFCATAVGQAVLKLHQRISAGREPLTGLAVDIHESWVHITRDGGYHEVHNHPNCSWCGIYYLDPGDCTLDPPNGINRFFSPIDLLYEDLGTEAYPQKPVSIAPDEGKLVLFPSYVKHLAAPYRGTRDRIIVSFNSRVIVPPPQARQPGA